MGRALLTVGGEPGGAVVRDFGLGLDATTGGGLESNTYRSLTTVEGGQGFGFVAEGDEAKAAQYQAEQAEKNSLGAALNEIFVDPLKNLGAGVVNSIVPGSNLGDSNNFFRSVGESVGVAAGAAIGAGLLSLGSKALNLGSAISTVERIVAPVVRGAEAVVAPVVRVVESIRINEPNMGFLDSIISAANSAITSPAGQAIIRNLNPGPPPQMAIPTPLVYGISQPAPSAPAPRPPAGTPSGTTQATAPASAMPSWAIPAAIALGFLLLTRRK